MNGVLQVTGLRGRRSRRALQAAAALDQLVDDQLPLLSALSMPSRQRVADHLAEVAMLASAYRAFALGAIGRAELNHRAALALKTIEAIRTGTPTG